MLMDGIDDIVETYLISFHVTVLTKCNYQICPFPNFIELLAIQ